MRRCIVGIRRPDEAEAAAKGKDVPTVWFPSMATMAAVLSEDNRTLLRIIRDAKPKTLTELAAMSGRQVPKLMAWEGALGVAPPEGDGIVISPEFAVFTINTEVMDIYFRPPEVWPELAEISGGTNMRRRRLQPSAFLGYQMPMPSMALQLKLRKRFRQTKELKAKHTAIRAANAALLPATLERVFQSREASHA